MTTADFDSVRSPSSEEARALLTDIYEHELPSGLADLIADYQEIEGARPPFMWKWVHKLAPQNTLPCVRDEFAEDVPVDKTITILFVTLLDDVLEKRRDRATFQAVSAIPFECQTVETDDDDVDAKYVTFAECVWETLLDRIERGPEYETYAELFKFDLKQAINAIEYSDLLIRRPDLATMADSERYESHNMAMFAYADIDLMHSPPVVKDELATLREAIWHAQQMARIGNWVSTWERELREGDFSTGVVVYALENDVIDLSDLREIEANEEQSYNHVVETIRANDVEDAFLRCWHDHYERLGEYDDEIETFDIAPFIEGTEEVLRYHLASTGLK